jgi:hypothetical protein
MIVTRWILLLPCLCALFRGLNAAAPQVIVSDPILVAEGPAEERRWGRYQFPALDRTLVRTHRVFLSRQRG